MQFVLLTIYCAPLVISHAANALELMSPSEMQQWLNVLVCACSEGLKKNQNPFFAKKRVLIFFRF